MQLTEQQLDIINSTGNIKINAIAGSGKTTTVIEYAATRPPESKILYLAFNKSVKTEASKRFAAKGLNNVKVETAHSLAYQHIIPGSKYRIKQDNYKSHEIAGFLGIKMSGDKHNEFVISNHILKFISYFCNSDKERVQDLNYLDAVFDPKARKFVKTFHSFIEKQTRVILGKMDSAAIEITHDFYLKKFQLSAPVLAYDYILFDEGQDASAAMLDVFLKQPATKVIVGDTNQQIYGWRYAINSLEKAVFEEYHLSESFRFGKQIADLSIEILKWKDHTGTYKPVAITGKGNSSAVKSKATLARTNLSLLLKAIEFTEESRDSIYFEGNFSSYTYADEGASLYDVLNLWSNKRKFIRDPLIKTMKNVKELEDYIEKTDEKELGMMLGIVKKYGNDIPGLIKKIKERHLGNHEKHQAGMIFSTVHRCKGMEYDEVYLADDFINEEKLEKLMEEIGEDAPGISKLNEEINLLYVAVTRTRNRIHIPESIVPEGVSGSEQIRIIKSEKKRAGEKGKLSPVTMEKFRPAATAASAIPKTEKTYSLEKFRAIHKEAYKPWTPQLDDELTTLYCKGIDIPQMTSHFGRNAGAIKSRIKKLELVDLYGIRDSTAVPVNTD